MCINILTLYIEQVEVLLSQFEWKSRDSPTETRLTDSYRSLSFVTPANFPRAVTYVQYGGWPMTSLIQCTRHCHNPWSAEEIPLPVQVESPDGAIQ